MFNKCPLTPFLGDTPCRRTGPSRPTRPWCRPRSSPPPSPPLSRLWRRPRGRRRRHRRRRERRHRHLRRRLRRPGRAGRGGQEGGHAPRHRAAAGLGQLRRDHQGVRGEVRHQDREREPGRAPAPTRSTPSRPARARTAPPTCSTSASPSRSAVPPRACSRRTRSQTFDKIPDGQKDADRALVQRLRRLHLHRLRRQEDQRPARRPSPTCSSPSTRARSRSTATRPSPARPSRGVYAAALANGGSFDDIQPGIDFFKQAEETRATSTRSSPPRPPSRRARRRSASTGTTSTPPTPTRSGRQGPRLEGRRPHRRQVRPVSTPRPSTRTPRTRPPPACGRSTSTAPRARTSGSRASPARCCCPP